MGDVIKGYNRVEDGYLNAGFARLWYRTGRGCSEGPSLQSFQLLAIVPVRLGTTDGCAGSQIGVVDGLAVSGGEMDDHVRIKTTLCGTGRDCA